MKKKNINCRICGKEMPDPHGNRRQHDECGDLARLERSKKAYALKSLRADPYWLNEKILREFYDHYGPGVEIDPKEIDDEGFDPDLIRGQKTINGTIVFVMNHHGFSLLKNKKIILWKF